MKWLVLLLFTPSVFAGSYINDYFTFSYNGNVNYTYASNDEITDQHNYAGVINTSISSEYGYLSSQFSTNEYNHIRRLLINVPIYSTDHFQTEFAIGRLTNSIGFINTNSNSSKLNNVVLLPLTAYDIRRYINLPDISDGVQLRFNYTGEDITTKITAFGGKQVLDKKEIPVYGSGFSLEGKSDKMFGFDIKTYIDNWVIHYAFTKVDGIITKTTPDYVLKYIGDHVQQKLHFFGIQYTFDDFKIQSEVSYRDVNLVTAVMGGYLSGQYQFNKDGNVYLGYSYGHRINEHSLLHDIYFGISYNIKDINVSLEQHLTHRDNWFYKANQPVISDEATTLLSITYSF